MTETRLSLKGKVVLITGMGQTQDESKGYGIGAAIAILFAREGAIICGGNRSLDSAERTRNIIRRENQSAQCTVHQTDVTSDESVEALVDACMAEYGRIDVLVNNVGRSEKGCPATMDPATWDAQININLKSVYLTCHHVLPIMERQGAGSIVSIGSIAGMRYIGKPQVAYAATKAALTQFIKATAVIYAPRGVRLNTVVPGLINTPYTAQMVQRYAEDGNASEFMRKRDEQVPMGRMGTAWDVANAALFLASDAAAYITGQKLVVDGGITSSTGRA
jgi:NAD(P)-dependent dehydrogenase (short-subunit alcohol dehydrogenase family)